MGLMGKTREELVPNGFLLLYTFASRLFNQVYPENIKATKTQKL